MKIPEDGPGRTSAGANKSLDKRTWYTPAAQAYDRTRPSYPNTLVDEAIKQAGLSAGADLLEIGCGPGTATVSFAERGFALTCVEPNLEFCLLAREKCQAFPNVEIINSLFEEWSLEMERFDAVLAATSVHWISVEEGYVKLARALKEKGHLILLWNTALQLQPELYQRVQPIFERHAPGLFRYESSHAQQQAIKEQGQLAVSSGYFKQPSYRHLQRRRTLKADEYVDLLSTYTPYLHLDEREQRALSDDLRKVIEREPGGSAQLSFLSVLQVYKKAGT